MDQCLKNKTFMVTGATGLIGQAIVKKLIRSNANVVAVVRDIEKAKRVFPKDDSITYLVTDIRDIVNPDITIDYIIHGASNTASASFIQTPVDVAMTAINGTIKTLEIARNQNVKGYVYLSSMEVYGTPCTDEKISELSTCNLDQMQPRSSYPESKRMCECLCASYYAQFGVPAKVVRLTQTFGPGVQYQDKRVFAEFARCSIERKDIVLHTKGETKRSYLYVDDAVDAILTVLFYGNAGEAYNAANEATYCSIYEMAEMVAKRCTNSDIEVKVEIDNGPDQFGYMPTLHMNLDTKKIQALGWSPKVSLEESYQKMIAYMIEHNSQ